MRKTFASPSPIDRSATSHANRRAKRLGRQALEHVALVAKPETILGWYRKLIAQKFDGSNTAPAGRPNVGREITELIVRMARENSD